MFSPTTKEARFLLYAAFGRWGRLVASAHRGCHQKKGTFLFLEARPWTPHYNLANSGAIHTPRHLRREANLHGSVELSGPEGGNVSCWSGLGSVVDQATPPHPNLRAGFAGHTRPPRRPLASSAGPRRIRVLASGAGLCVGGLQLPYGTTVPPFRHHQGPLRDPPASSTVLVAQFLLYAAFGNWWQLVASAHRARARFCSP